jgi:hypothetical protein
VRCSKLLCCYLHYSSRVVLARNCTPEGSVSSLCGWLKPLNIVDSRDSKSVDKVTFSQACRTCPASMAGTAGEMRYGEGDQAKLNNRNGQAGSSTISLRDSGNAMRSWKWGVKIQTENKLPISDSPWHVSTQHCPSAGCTNMQFEMPIQCWRGLFSPPTNQFVSPQFWDSLCCITASLGSVPAYCICTSSRSGPWRSLYTTILESVADKLLLASVNGTSGWSYQNNSVFHFV